MAAFATLTADFAAPDAQFTLTGAAAISGGALNVPMSSGYSNSAITATTYDLTGSHVLMQVTHPGPGETIYSLSQNADPSSNAVGWSIYEDGQLYATAFSNGVYQEVAVAAYDATAMSWLRIREAGGTTYWDTSPDGAAWTAFGSTPNPVTLTALYLIALSGAATSGTSTFDNVNTVLTGRVIDRWNGTSLVRQRSDRWNGSALVPQKSTT